jgi:hypothetical protein
MLNDVASWLIVGLRPLLGPALCYHETGCSVYAVQCLKQEGFFRASYLIFKRLASCNPITQWFRFFNKSVLFSFFLLISVTHMNVCVATLVTEDISVNQCNPESLRSKELLLKLVTAIKETCSLMNNQNPKISASAHGLSVMYEIEEPLTYIILTTENESNELHCSIKTKYLTKQQKQTIKEKMKKLFCTKQS